MTAKKQQELWTCDICAAEGVTATFKAPTALGMHKRLKHGIVGQSKASQKYREAKKEHIAAKAAGESGTTKYEQLRTKKEKKVVKQTKTKRIYQKRQETSKINDTEALITVGYIQASCEAKAKKLGISEESFTRRCSELFFASQIR